MLHLFLDNNRGAVIIITLILVSILVILCTTVASVVTFGGRNAAWQRCRVQSFYCAEAGLNKGIVLARADKNWTTGGDGSATHNYPGEDVWYYLYDGGADAHNVAFGGGTYSVSLRNPSGGVGNVLEVKSEGSVSGVKNSDRKVKVQLRIKSFAIFGRDSVDIGGNALTDSYNSGQGLYGVNGNIGQEGNVGSNGSVILHGGSCTVGGEIIDNAGITLPPLNIPAFTPSGNVNGSRTLADGIYYFNNITLSSHEVLETNGNVTIYCNSASFGGQSIIRVNGKLTFYCTGDFKLTGGGLINTSQKPENFILYCTGSTVKLTGGAEFYGAVYAPNADINLNGGVTYYGAIVGKIVNVIGGPVIHYDEALKNVFNPAYKVKITSWQEGI
ncbi:hypothetical protein FJZ31_24450 [Candidatus Poribacteria bacterium]|nr:hypothetical protein [Candidatus Poribacteria bacterium]